jgi:CDP-diacylglycerol--serine O-phosphatidyltransferase
MALKSQIPNLFTLSNLLCGALAVYAITQDQLLLASYLILIAALFDFADGLVARLLNVPSELGKQLDSLADMVSFGLAPSFFALSMMGSLGRPLEFSWPTVFAFLPLLMTAFSAYRLAKFNIDTRQSEQFIGMPTPANALLWLSFPLIAAAAGPSDVLTNIYSKFMNSDIAIVMVSLLCSALLVSELPLLALKFKSLKFSENVFRFLLLGISAVLLLLFWVQAIPIILILYLILSSIQTFIRRNHGI